MADPQSHGTTPHEGANRWYDPRTSEAAGRHVRRTRAPAAGDPLSDGPTGRLLAAAKRRTGRVARWTRAAIAPALTSLLGAHAAVALELDHQASLPPVDPSSPAVLASGLALLLAALLVGGWAGSRRQGRSHARDRISEQMSAVLTHVDLAIALVDSQGLIRWSNPEFVRAIGIAGAEIIGRSAADVIFRTDPDHAGRTALSDAVARRASLKLDIDRGPPGALRQWFAMSLRPTDVDAVDGTMFALSLTDITQTVSQKLFLETALEAAAAGFVIQDEDGRILDANPEAERLLGLPIADMRGISSTSPRWKATDLSGAAIPDARNPVMQALATGEPVNGSIVSIQVSESLRRWIRINCRPGIDPATGERIAITSFTDVTDMQRREDGFRQAEALAQKTIAELSAYKAALDQLAVVSVTDSDGVIRHVNDNFCLSTGYSREELIGKTYVCLSSKRHPQSFFDEMVATVKSGRVWRAEICNQRKDGGLIWHDTTKVPVFDQTGAITSVVAIRYDVSEQRRAESILRDAIEIIPDGFVVFDEQDRLITCNKAYRQIYAPTAEWLVPGAHFPDLLQRGIDVGQFPEAGTTPQSQADWIAERLQRHQSPSVDVVQQLANGRWVQIRERRTPTGHIVGFRTDITDIMRQKRVQQAVVDNFPGGLIVIGPDLRMALCNQRYREIFDLPDSLFDNGLPLMEDIFRARAWRGEDGADDVEAYVDQRLSIFRNDEAHLVETRRPDGRIFEVRGTPIPGGGFVSTFTEITERVQSREELIASKHLADQRTEELKTVLEHMNQGISVYDKDQRITIWNRQYADIFGMTPEQVQPGMTLLELLEIQRQAGNFDRDPRELQSDLMAKLASHSELRAVTRLGDGRVVHTVHSPAPDGSWVATHEDITERELAANRILYAAHHDILTGLANRAEIKNRISSAFATAIPRNESFSLLLVDLDRFKAVNDTFGHATGDKLLQMVADRLQRHIRTDDVVARLGGDEFAVYFAATANQHDDTALVAARLQAAVSMPYLIDGHQIQVGASVGAAIAPDGGKTTDELFRNADSALYNIKSNGRNGCRLFDSELENAVRDRREMEADLSGALERGEFSLAYQPIYATTTRQIEGVEALLRWHHPRRGLVPPSTFVPLAEETGLIDAIGTWVIERACLDAATWPLPIQVAVNVSPVQLGTKRLVDSVLRALVASNLRSDRLELEVTETVLLKNDDLMLEDLHRLHQLGICIALDDFGTGYSSLSHLRLFPFDKIKIDKSFVADLETNTDCAAIICALTGLARNMDIRTTGEGVETDAQLQLLRAAGCSLAQGYLLSRPVGTTQIVHLLNQQIDARRALLQATA